MCIVHPACLFLTYYYGDIAVKTSRLCLCCSCTWLVLGYKPQSPCHRHADTGVWFTFIHSSMRLVGPQNQY